MEEVLLEQQIVWLQEGKLLLIVTISSCSNVDLEFAVSLPFKILTIVCTTASELSFQLTLQSFLPQILSSSQGVHIKVCITKKLQAVCSSVPHRLVSLMLPPIATWLAESSNSRLSKSLLTRTMNLLSCPVCNATYPPQLTLMLQML